MTEQILRIAALGSGTFALPASTACFESLDQLLAQPQADVLILTGSPEQNAGWARQLRRHPAYTLSLIYCASDHPLTQALTDGPLPEHPLQVFEQWRERLAVFNRGRAPEGPEAQLLAYLWLRAPGSLKALRAPESPALYHYPLIDALGDGQLNGHALVQSLVQRNLLENSRLVDRIRLCRSCGSGHLNYVDVCVECSSLEIVREPSLHCFTCGHVGAQAEYLKDGVLVCPNCLTRLRHVGTDYDRPLENYSCKACSAFFVDADIQARCLDCGQQHAPDELLVRQVHDHHLSEGGLLAARQGLERDFDQYFGGLSLVGVNAFKTLLDWQLELIARHGSPTFAVLGVRFKNLGTALARLGPQRGHALLDTLIERIQVAIRDTDRCTRTIEEHLWLLLMCTDDIGLQRVTERLNQISELFVGQDLQDIVLTTSSCVAPTGLVDKEDAELLMARLAGAL